MRIVTMGGRRGGPKVTLIRAAAAPKVRILRAAARAVRVVRGVPRVRRFGGPRRRFGLVRRRPGLVRLFLRARRGRR